MVSGGNGLQPSCQCGGGFGHRNGTGLARGWQSSDGFAGRHRRATHWARCAKVFGNPSAVDKYRTDRVDCADRFAPSSIINARCRRERNTLQEPSGTSARTELF